MNNNHQPFTNASPFDRIRQIDAEGHEYWSAGDLQFLLEYTDWRKFDDALERAIIACTNRGQRKDDHFGGGDKMVQISSGGQRKVIDYLLTNLNFAGVRKVTYQARRGKYTVQEYQLVGFCRRKTHGNFTRDCGN